jgi:membrane protein involved in colicin uptake
MKLTTGILAVAMMTTGLWAQNQNPNVTQNVQSTTTPVQQKKTQDSNAAPGTKNVQPTRQTSKPAAGSATKAVSPVAQKNAPALAAKAPGVAKAQATPHPKTQSAVAAKTQTAPAVRKGAVVAPAIVAKKSDAKKGAVTVLSAAPSSPFDNKKAEAKPADAKAVEASKSADAAKAAPKPEDKKWAMSGKRDPFFSPVVQAPTGSGCSTGKKCLEIGQINVHGVVKSDTGFIAVVTNNLGKAYFLRENDPVFNGYVMRITGDTVVFQETYEDKLGKPLTREVVKRLYTPAV